MSVALLSLLALLVAIIIGCIRTDMNTGTMSVTFAYIIGIYFAAMKTTSKISAGFPADLFLMLVGITLLFAMAKHNGTLDKISQVAISVSRGNPKLLPIIFFLLTFVIAAIGPGNIAATALIAPVGMAVAARAGISSFLMAIMICTGANAGAFSPVAPTGVIGIGLMNKIGVTDPRVAITVFLAAAAIQSISAFVAYVLFGGYKAKKTKELEEFLASQKVEALDMKQKVTLLAILALVIAVIFFKVPISLAAFVLAFLLSLFKIGDEEKSIKSLPWATIMLVTGVTVLIEIMAKTGGLDLATTAIAKYSSVKTVNAVLAFITGVISAYSSSSGVVMPAFIPLIPGLIQKLGGGDIIKMIIAVDVGAHMVDVSPLSTLGALCMAAAAATENRARLFRNLLIWGLSMSVVGAILAFIFLDLL